jgi:hypothetical protein
MLKFFREHALATWALVLGPLITIAVKVNDAYTLYNLGLPRLVWEAIGGGIFFLAVFALLYRFYNQHQAASVGPDSNSRAAPPPQVDASAATALYTYPEAILVRERFYSKADKDKISDIMTRVWETYNPKGVWAETKSAEPSMRAGSVPWEELDKHQQAMLEVRTEVAAIATALLAIRLDSANFISEMNTLLLPDDAIGKFEKAADDFANMIAVYRYFGPLAKDEAGPMLGRVLNTQREQLEAARNAFRGWMQNTNYKIETTRKALKQ